MSVLWSDSYHRKDNLYDIPGTPNGKKQLISRSIKISQPLKQVLLVRLLYLAAAWNILFDFCWIPFIEDFTRTTDIYIQIVRNIYIYFAWTWTLYNSFFRAEVECVVSSRTACINSLFISVASKYCYLTAAGDFKVKRLCYQILYYDFMATWAINWKIVFNYNGFLRIKISAPA